MTLLFHLVMATADVGILAIYRHRRSVQSWLIAAALGAVLAALVAASFAKNHFDLAGYAALAIFVHAPLVLLGTAVISGRKNWPWTAMTGLSAVLLWGIAVDAFWIEPHWLEVTHYEIRSPKISQPLRIVVVADLQLDAVGDYERGVLRRALAEEPDLLLLAGDYIQAKPADQRRLIDALQAFLQEIDLSAPQGAFAVKGNVEPLHWEEMFAGTKIIPVATRQTFTRNQVQLTCLSLFESYVTSLAVSNPDSEKFHIVMGHVPNFALGTIQADLLIAGHTHGGQVRLPGIGPLITNSRIPRAWAAGMTNLPHGGNLLIPRGIGLERNGAPRLRFLCRPELAIVDLLPKESR